MVDASGEFTDPATRERGQPKSGVEAWTDV